MYRLVLRAADRRGSASIDTPTTWNQYHIYHCKSYVAVNAPLTIEGATVTFNLQKGMIVQGNGKLISRNAVFTSSAGFWIALFSKLTQTHPCKFIISKE